MMVAATPRSERASPILRVAALGEQAALAAERLRDSVVVVAGRRHGAGSGTIWGSDGLIVTNNHVVPADTAEVTLPNGLMFAAQVVGRDKESDLAALRIAASGLPAVEVRDSDSVRVGEIVIAVGNPWGQAGFVSSGIVFSKNGSEVDGSLLAKAIKADLALAPGNSGGPLADSEGRVLGINAMIVGGMAVAVPSNTVTEFLSDGVAPPGMIGIAGHPVPVSAVLQSADDAGLIITSIAEDSPAEAAGLIPGDVLLAIDGGPRSVEGVARGLKRLRAGRTVSLTVARAGVLRDFEVTPSAQS
jgi:serine protease Do